MHYTEFYCKILIFLLQDTEFIQKKIWQVCKWSSLVPHPLTHLAVVGFSDLLLAILISYRPTGLGQHTMKQDCHATHLFSQQVQNINIFKLDLQAVLTNLLPMGGGQSF